MQETVERSDVKYYLITLNVNGEKHTRAVKANTLLVNLLRDELDLTGTKKDANWEIAAPALSCLTANR